MMSAIGAVTTAGVKLDTHRTRPVSLKKTWAGGDRKRGDPHGETVRGDDREGGDSAPRVTDGLASSGNPGEGGSHRVTGGVPSDTAAQTFPLWPNLSPGAGAPQLLGLFGPGQATQGNKFSKKPQRRVCAKRRCAHDVQSTHRHSGL